MQTQTPQVQLPKLTYLPSRTGYDSWNPGWFRTDEKEISKISIQTIIWSDIENKVEVLNFVKNATNGIVKAVSVHEFKNHAKRSNHDSARLIVVHLEDGVIVAKRHNNSQWFKIKT